MSASATASPIAAVALDEVSYRYPAGTGARGKGEVEYGVSGVSLTLAPGEVLGLLGPNGSGKSTLLSLVAGFLRPDSGSVRVLGEEVSASVRRRVGVVFQDASVDPLMTVGETLRLHGRLFGVGGSRLRQRTEELLARMGLSERVGDRVETLSGGLRRRVELARAVLHEPAVLLLDEPSLGLDLDSRGALWDLLDGVQREGTALLLATNDVAEAERACDRVAFLQEGRVVAVGSPEELKRELRRDSVRVEWPGAPEDVASRLAGMPGVGTVRVASLRDGGSALQVTVDAASAFVPALFAFANSEGANSGGAAGEASGGIAGIRIRESTLEDAYFQLVGAPLGPPADQAGAANGRMS